jgi:hypothetical protein
MHALCSECGCKIESQLVTQEFEREGTRMEVAGICALVCQKCGEIYFVTGGAQAVVEAGNSLSLRAKTISTKENMKRTAYFRCVVEKDFSLKIPEQIMRELDLHEGDEAEVTVSTPMLGQLEAKLKEEMQSQQSGA